MSTAEFQTNIIHTKFSMAESNNRFTYDQLVEAMYQGNQQVPWQCLPPQPFHPGMDQQLHGTYGLGMPPPQFHFTYQYQQGFSPAQTTHSDFYSESDYQYQQLYENANQQQYWNSGGTRYSQDNGSQGDGRRTFHQRSADWGYQGPPHNFSQRGRGRGSQTQNRGQGLGRGQSQFRSATFTRGHSEQYNSAPRHRREQAANSCHSDESRDPLYSKASHQNYRPAEPQVDSGRGSSSSGGAQGNMYIRKVDRHVSHHDTTDGARNPNANGEKDTTNIETNSSSKVSPSKGRNRYSGMSAPKDGRFGGQGQASGPSTSLARKQFSQNNYHKKVMARATAPEAENEDEGSQRARMQDQLSRSCYECMVCCDNIRHEVAVWSCSNCFHIFHLRCIKQWARSSLGEGQDVGWRCPACQNVTHRVPNQYRCFCGKVRDPQYQPGEIPHSCGEVCKKRRGGDCSHRCVILCHPGPCPPCNAVVNRTCDCGQERKSMRCGHTTQLKCEKVCGKDLNCKKHVCQGVCHAGNCPPCKTTVQQECYGGHRKQEVLCGSEEAIMISFSCGQQCHKTLGCGNHVCEELCHPGDCGPCALLPKQVTHCCCGQTPVEGINAPPRKSCLDPPPTCDEICNKTLSCGPRDDPHRCQRKCHEGACGECEGVTELTCVCDANKKEFHCKELAQFTATDPFKCERRCNKKRMCGRHKCNETCCTRDVHICELTCSRPLNCKQHKCEELCHRGNCKPCLQASFEELTCHCGAEVIYPPVPCGTNPPSCHRICKRSHPCDHPVRHQCHSDDLCPPCTELVQKSCVGDHELRKNVPCHMTDISCGRPCGKPISCGQHRCQRLCHKGVCLPGGETCKQPCTKKRADCGHACGAPCHVDAECPGGSCKAQMEIKCGCGNRSAQTQCQAGSGLSSEIAQFQRLTVQAMASGGSGQDLDISHLTQQKKNTPRQLECDSNCAMRERNRRLALALEIQNPDLDAKLSGPKYSDFLKDFCRKTPAFVAKVEKALSDLVQNAKQSKHSSRSYAFPSMNRDQRRLVHELAEAYGCETQSYDYEPNKNVVATASKNKCWLPSVTLTASVSRKAPPPIPHHTKPATAWSEETQSTVLGKEKEKEKEKADIDYFDFSPK